jgi:hypothetical protein
LDLDRARDIDGGCFGWERGDGLACMSVDRENAKRSGEEWGEEGDEGCIAA